MKGEMNKQVLLSLRDWILEKGSEALEDLGEYAGELIEEYYDDEE